MDKDIKDYREKELKHFVLGNVLLILVGTGLIQSIIQALNENNSWHAFAGLVNSSIISAIIYIFVFVVDSVVPSTIKERIIWPFGGVPGSTIFSEIMLKNRDERFSEDDAKIAYSEIYDKIEAETDIRKRNIIQNKSWYKIYQKHESQAQVYVSHRDFLLCRDMSVMTIWIVIGFEIFSLYIGTGLLSGLTAVFIIEFLIIWIATRVKGKRFAYNVIAKDLGSSKENKDI